jgi:hypothetical protein
MSMKRVGILLLMAALSATAQTRSMGPQHGPMSMSSSGRGAAPGPSGSVTRTWNNNNDGWHRGTGHFSGGGVRSGNWTFRTGPPNRGCPGFNCVSYPYYPSYYPVIATPYYPSYGYATTYDPYPVPPSAPAVPEGQYIVGDNSGSQASAYDAGYAAGLQTQAATASRYGNHYLDSRESAQPAPENVAPSSVTTIQGSQTQPATRSYTSAAPAQIGPATVLVFKDGHTVDVHNYAIIGQTLWNLNEQIARKIPLSELDLDATVKANDDRGIPFKLPTTHD